MQGVDRAILRSTAQSAAIAPPLHDVLPVVDIAMTLPADAHDVFLLRAPAVGIPFKVVRLQQCPHRPRFACRDSTERACGDFVPLDEIAVCCLAAFLAPLWKMLDKSSTEAAQREMRPVLIHLPLSSLTGWARSFEWCVFGFLEGHRSVSLRLTSLIVSVFGIARECRPANRKTKTNLRDQPQVSEDQPRTNLKKRLGQSINLLPQGEDQPDQPDQPFLEL